MMPKLPGLPVQIAVALLVGALIGWAWPTAGLTLQPLGTAFIAAVKMVVIPLMFCAVTLGTLKMGLDTPRLGRMALVAFGWFFAGAIAILIGLTLDALFHPGLGIAMPAGARRPAMRILQYARGADRAALRGASINPGSGVYNVTDRGEVAERLIAPVLKTGGPSRGS